MAEILPVFVPKQLAAFAEIFTHDSADGWVIVIEVNVLHPLASVTTIVYIFADKLVNVPLPLILPGCKTYCKAPVPPLVFK